jgi:hypothetical protein
MRKKLATLVSTTGLILITACKSSQNNIESDSLTVLGPNDKKIFSLYLDENKEKKDSQLLWCAYEVNNGQAKSINPKAWSISKSELNKAATGIAAAVTGLGGSVTSIFGCSALLFGAAAPAGLWCLGGMVVGGGGFVGGGIAETKSKETLETWKLVMDIKGNPKKMNDNEYKHTYETIKKSGNTNRPCENIDYTALKDKIDARINEEVVHP